MTTSGISHRAAWLARPCFIASILVLALNDHVLKAHVPSWWTGKLSDVAGVVMVGVVASVLFGRSRGLVLTALAFAALKTVPGVAELAAPVLGGRTLRDPSDVLAVAALVPLWWWLGRTEQLTPPPQPPRGRLPFDPSSGVAIGACALAVVVGTATSCSGPPPTVAVEFRDGAAFAYVMESGLSSPSGYDSWWRSEDDGRTWSDVDDGRPAATTTDAMVATTTVPPPPPPVPATKSCADDGACYRVVDQRRIERIHTDGRVTVEYELTDGQLAASTGSCGTGPMEGVLTSIAVDPADDERAIAGFGIHGTLVRDDGRWIAREVSPWQVGPLGEARSTLANVMMLAYGGLLALAVALAGRRWSGWAYGVTTALVGWVVVLAGAGLIVWMVAPSYDAGLGVTLTWTGYAALTAVTVAVVAARSRVLDRRPRV